MYNIKKKLGSLIPGEGARGALQNVLTVEWSGHKTVLVEVPNAGSSRSNEVEMSGLGDDGRPYGEYGKLEDDYEEERAYLTQPRGYFDQPRSQTRGYDDETPPPLPPKPYRSETMPAIKPTQRFKSNNPFASDLDAIDALDFDPRPLPKPQHQSFNGKPAARQARDMMSFDEPQRGWRTFSGEDNQAPVDPWVGRGWGTGNGQGQTSPTSSTDTRFSGTSLMSEDPFKN